MEEECGGEDDVAAAERYGINIVKMA